MKEFIKEAQSVSENKEDFLTIMQDNGYAIANQTVDSVIWWNKSHTRKIRDTTLGMEYKLGTLFPDTDHSPEYEIRNDKVTHKPSKPISIARYDWNGRRRSDLEILIRKALEILRRVGNHYQPKTVLTSLPTTRKIEMMEQALVFCKHFLDKIAKYFWTLLQNVFGHCCMSKLDKVAMPRLAA